MGGKSTGVNARVFVARTGSAQGEVTGATKGVLSVAISPSGKQLVITSQDFKSRLYTGPPFKFAGSSDKHTNFVNCVRFSPDGSRYVTVGSDKQVLVYDASGGLQGALPVEHSGSIYSCDWNAEGDRVVTSSGDKTCKVWDMEAMKCEATLPIKARPGVEDMQVAVCYAEDDQIISVSLDGSINYLKPGKKVGGAWRKREAWALTRCRSPRGSSLRTPAWPPCCAWMW